MRVLYHKQVLIYLHPLVKPVRIGTRGNKSSMELFILLSVQRAKTVDGIAFGTCSRLKTAQPESKKRDEKRLLRVWKRERK